MLFLYAALFGTVLSFPEHSYRKKGDGSLQDRAVCYDDDISLSFRKWILDSEPYCSSLLGIEDVTSTLPPGTSRTTTTTIIDDVTTLPGTLTVPQVTALETTTTTVGRVLKREAAATITSTIDVEPQPYPYEYNYVSSLALSMHRDAAIASSVFSACSCLSIAPKTVSSQATIQTTRTISGRIPATKYAATVTGGTSTLTVTQTVLPQPTVPSYNASISSANNGSISNTSLPTVTTISLTSTRINTIYSTGTGLPFSHNTTSISPPYPAGNTTSRASPTSAPSSVRPPSSSSSSIPTTSSTTSSLLPIGTSIAPGGCPTINNTIYSLPTGEQYQLQCYRAYGGPVSIGLDQPYFRDCIDECSTVNRGFSAIRCFGVTWLKYAQGIHCNLKGQSVLANYTTDYMAVSAVLLTGVPVPVFGAFPNRAARRVHAEDLGVL
ncbi:MAG: hypothetical protein Q9219_002241 [cf. Caloplaca sp. 3 TL-2023]